MDISENDYCRLCADLKQCSDLTNMGINIKKRREIDHKLARFNIRVNFNVLPKTVCFECINSLEGAYDFVTTVDLAQEAFKDYTITPAAYNMKDKVNFDNNIMEYELSDASIKDDNSVKSELNIQESYEAINEEIEIEYDIKKEPKRVNLKSKPKKVNAKSKSKMSNKNTKPPQRKNPKYATDVDLESWQDYKWLCGYCDRYLTSPSELKVHSMQYHSTCNAYRCSDCRVSVLHLDNFITHICRHRPILSLTCYKCSLQCSTLKKMKTHKATHCDSEYICIGCNTTFSSQDELDDHTNTYFKNAEANSSQAVTENDSLTCVICAKTSKTRVLLNRHLLIHTERKRGHICDVCGKSFYNKKELVQHVVVHSDARPFTCEVCKFSFKVKSELKKHVAIHFGPKRFACQQCGRCFRLRKELGVHSAVHRDTRPYVCTYCNKSFRFRHLLMQHLRLHTGVKPYTCNFCPLTFRNWSNFNKHTREVHGVDNAKRKRTSDGLYAIDPDTKKVIYPETNKVLEWKKKILTEEKKGRPKKMVENSEPTVKCVTELDSMDSDS